MNFLKRETEKETQTGIQMARPQFTLQTPTTAVVGLSQSQKSKTQLDFPTWVAEPNDLGADLLFPRLLI